MRDLYYAVGEMVVGTAFSVAFIAGAVWAWMQLSGSTIGRWMQFGLCAAVYGCWLAAPIAACAYVLFWSPHRPAANTDSAFSFVFASAGAVVACVFLLVQLGIGLACWGGFVDFAERKVGLHLPLARQRQW